MERLLATLQKPFAQSILFLGLTVLLLLIVRPKQEEMVWTLAGILYILFILTNSIFLFWQTTVWSYFFYSLLFTLIYLFSIQGLVAAHLRLFTTTGAGESSMIFLVVIYHPFALLFVIFLKWLYRVIF